MRLSLSRSVNKRGPLCDDDFGKKGTHYYTSHCRKEVSKKKIDNCTSFLYPAEEKEGDEMMERRRGGTTKKIKKKIETKR